MTGAASLTNYLTFVVIPRFLFFNVFFKIVLLDKKMMSPLKPSKKNIIAIVLGNALEWYDFVIYSFLTIFIAKLFFPNVNDTNSLLATTATFGVAFCMRPLGGIVLGIYADKYGRKAAMTRVITMMTLAIFIITAAPTYAQAGIIAPVLIVIARLLQGFSAGGEFGTSTAMLIELSPPAQRGFYGSWQMVGQILAMLLGALISLLLTQFLSIEQIESWGFRLPFIVGLLIAPVGIYIRLHLDETHIDDSLLRRKNHFAQKIWQHVDRFLIAMGLVIGGTVSTYTNLIYMPTYAAHYLHLSLTESYAALMAGVLLMVVLMPFFGWWSDRIGRKPILLTALVLYLFSIYPLFWWLGIQPSVAKLISVQLIFCLLLAAYFSVFAVIIAELFPKEIRSTGLSISYNLAVMLFGGFAQFIVTWLISAAGTPLAITYYLIAAIIMSLIAAILYQEKGMRYEHS
ncbi:Proline/betaine transporter [Aquicella lusitana]|uniref:Putative MFS family arabinose efflux permease n=2 Tax=Aquicella lusitana TaxID=254246 RepID=A0A370GTC6_9COXI|nr:putative MFS family arabinose efflux permease [Aquicella lusitana]VVC72757.1 Proline/betaine transporter [Aquicella lusitana]